eukprot:scaffold68492_cov49-Cyclotella_meneghiniana.AAC.1
MSREYFIRSLETFVDLSIRSLPKAARRLAVDVLETLCCFLFETGSFACFTCNYSKTSNPCHSKWHMLSLAQKSSCGFV